MIAKVQSIKFLQQLKCKHKDNMYTYLILHPGVVCIKLLTTFNHCFVVK